MVSRLFFNLTRVISAGPAAQKDKTHTLYYATVNEYTVYIQMNSAYLVPSASHDED